MAKSAKSQYAVLGMLALLKKCSGYDLKKAMEGSTQYFWKETFSSIYPILEDLEQQQLIRKLDLPTRSDRKRNVYTLTAKGKSALGQWLLQPPADIQVRNELLLKLFFGQLVSVKVNIEHLEQYQQALTTKLAAFQAAESALKASKSPAAVYSLIAVDHGISQTLSALAWCTTAIKKLKLLQKQTT